MISVNNMDQLWSTFLQDAKLYEQKGEAYLSPTEGGKYQIISTANDVIRIERLYKPGSYETISLEKFGTCIKRINKLSPLIPKGNIYDHVAEETTLVELLPMLDWSDDGKSIVVNSNEIKLENLIESKEAKNDDIDQRRIVSVRVRRGQNKFREKLLSLYNSKCVISGCAVKEVLNGCHINPHSRSGNNLSYNGIILRSDIHDLFDENLIGINPESLKVKVHKSLAKTEYFVYNDIDLAKRNDSKKPDKSALEERWQEFQNQD